MADFYSSLMLTGFFRTLLIILSLLFFIVIAEFIFCITAAMKFRVEKISGFRERFLSYYAISVNRNGVSLRESKNSWFLWLSVCTGNIKMSYLPLHPYQSISDLSEDTLAVQNYFRVLVTNTVIIMLNTKSYIIMALSVPFYLIFTICSYFERTCRLLLDPVVFISFLALAKLKIFIIYHFKGKTLIVDSFDTDATCTIDVIYRKPVIRIVLHSPRNCSDSMQKDNINHFTTTLKSFLPPQHYVKFKTEIVYSEDEETLKAELPMTFKYLHSTFAKRKYIKSREVSS